MHYRAVGNRCAVDFDTLSVPLSNEEVMTILIDQGFKTVDVNLMRLAHSCIGVSTYRRSVRPSEAPAVVDCSSLMKWLYGMFGIWLPRRTIQQRELGEPVGLQEIAAGDLIFVSGKIDYYVDDPSQGVGHVGIVTNEGMVIHAADKKHGVIKQELEEFLGEHQLRGIRRYISSGHHVLTLETPSEREIESSDDIRWIVLQELP